MKAKIFTMLKIIVGIAILGYFLFLIEFKTEQPTLTENEVADTNTTQHAKLNIALVNEDAGAQFEGRPYQLGKSYIKKIEKDPQQEWFIVSRGIAENGIKQGTYHLMITIPSNFSAKLLDINEANPEKTRVSYKVNANGNKDLEKESEQVGKSIVAELNQELVDIYMASILGNLYSAQNNIQKVMDNQNIRIGDYQSQVYQPAIGFKDNLGIITGKASASKEANDGLNEVIKASLSEYNLFEGSQATYKTNLEKLSAMRASGMQNYAQFVEQLIAMEGNVLNQDVSELYNKVSSTSSGLTTEFELGNLSNLPQQLTDLETDLGVAKDKIKQETETLEQQIGFISDYVDEKIKDKYQIYPEQGNALSVKDFLIKSNKTAEEKDKTAAYLKGISEEVAQKEADIKSFSQYSVDRLPYVSAADVDDKLFDLVTDNSSKIKDDIKEIEKINMIGAGRESMFPYGFTANNDVWKQVDDAYRNLNDYYKDLADKEKTITFANRELRGKTKITIKTPSTIVIKKVVIAGNENYEAMNALNDKQKAELDVVELHDADYPINIVYTIKPERWFDYPESEKNIALKAEFEPNDLTITPDSLKKIKPTATTKKAAPIKALNPVKSTQNSETNDTENSSGSIDPEEPESSTDPEEPGETEEPEEPEEPGETEEPEEPIYLPERPTLPFVTSKKLDFAEFATSEYQQKVATYTKVITNVTHTYKDAKHELRFLKDFMVRESDGKWEPLYFTVRLDKLLNMNVYDYLDMLVSDVLTTNLGEYQTHLQNTIRLQDTVYSIEKRLPGIGEKMGTIRTNTSELQTNIAEQLVKLDEWSEDMRSLTTAEGDVANFNQETDSDIDAKNSELDSLMDESNQIKSATEQNKTEAENVTDVFNDFNKDVVGIEGKGESLAKEADSLMKDFDTQLSTNKTFVDQFKTVLANAHQDGVSNETLLKFLANPIGENAEGSIQSPDTYKPFTLLITLFILTLFTGYAFANDKLRARVENVFEERHLVVTNLPVALLLLIASVVIGLLAAGTTQSALNIAIDSKMMWYVCLVTIVLLFTLPSGYLIRQLKLFGMGIQLFFLASYIFLTDAVGKGSGTSTVANVVKEINPIYHAETILLKFFSQTGLGWRDLSMVWFISALLIILNLVVWFPTLRKGENKDD